MSKIRQAQERIRETQTAGKAPGALAVSPATVGKIASRQAASGIEADFETDVASLKGLTLEAKAVLKRRLVEKYRVHAERFLASGHGSLKDDITARWVIWLWDIGDIEGYLAASRKAEALNQRSPLNTPLREFRWYRVLDWANAEHKEGRSPEPYFTDVLGEADAMPGSIASGYHILSGKLAQGRAEQAEADGFEKLSRQEYQAARAAYERAKSVHDKSRVETALKQVIRKLEL